MIDRTIYNVHPLFEDVQLSRIFIDGKTFVDCLPRQSFEQINEAYQQERSNPGFNLKRFVLNHFILPEPHSTFFKSEREATVEENIDRLWDVLTREPDLEGGSLIPLPYPYIVPGGRFGEIYYWDSYFTMLGLKAAGKFEMIENMVKNFSFLIDSFGYIPNGNRSYFLGRSQPPFYSLMVELLTEIKGRQVLADYREQLEKEYSFWMNGVDELNENNPALHRVVRMKDGEILNRFWDENNTARPESFAADMELAEQSNQERSILFRHLRAGAESGWDYSCRWFGDEDNFGTIRTTDIIPVDLNGLLYHLEKTIANACKETGDETGFTNFEKKAKARVEAIQKYCWNADKGFFFDYDWKDEYQKNCMTLAATTALYFGYCTQEQANTVAHLINEKFLNDGGLVTTLKNSGQQWDAPNGWAPLHWMAITGLERFGHHQLAETISKRWIRLNTNVFKRTGKLMEKYNVVDTHLDAGGGEYEGQDGFGWTNGVLLALKKKYETQPTQS